MKFLCDEMLAKLGKWLRAAGYDTKIVTESCDDSAILAKAIDEKRYLLTRDHLFLEMDKSDSIVIWFSSDLWENCIKELSEKLPINWTLAPFSRCLICNNPLVEVVKENYDIPNDICQSDSPLLFCNVCNKVFWEGSHTKHMLDQLNSWNLKYQK